MSVDRTTQSDLLAWIQDSHSAFDVAVCKQEHLETEFTVIDSDELNAKWEDAFTKKVGAVPLRRAYRNTERVAHRVAQRLAASASAETNVSTQGLTAAWFHPILAELSTLLPIRQLARRIANQHAGKPIAIRLKTRQLTALDTWYENDIEPIYLAVELRRRKATVLLFIESDGEPLLTFQLSKVWLPKGYPQFSSDRSFTSVMSKNAIRRPEFTAAQTGISRRHRPGIFQFDRLFGFYRGLKPLSLRLLDGPRFGPVKTYAAPPDVPSLNQAFSELFVPLTQKAGRWIRTKLEGRKGLSVHIADHASFEGGLLAGEVLRNGGRIFLWPHSANAVQTDLHSSGGVARITVAARSTGAAWAAKFGSEKIVVEPDSILPNTSEAPAYNDAKPVHVVLFAGAHALRRLPLIDYKSHRETWAQVLKQLQDAKIELTVKHKSIWETREWIANLAEKPEQVRFSDVHANKLDLANMVFLSISLTSTAIFEGIARGIPGMVIRDFPVDETPHYDPDFIPCVQSEKAAEFIESLSGREAWERLRDRQRLWFTRETSLCDTLDDCGDTDQEADQKGWV